MRLPTVKSGTSHVVCRGGAFFILAVGFVEFSGAAVSEHV